jgi:F-type H+-transporting ATPase subunit gamma
MAGGQERILRRRIKSVESTKKITRAMELIAATRVVKAQERAAAARPYAEEITAVILDLVRAGAARDSTLLQSHDEANTAGFVVITSDRGLCGAYNSTIIRNAEREIANRQANGQAYRLFLVGKKALTYFRFRGYDIDESFLGVTDQPVYDQAREIATAVRRRFEAAELSEVNLCYWRFLSAGVQQPVIRKFLPLQVEESQGLTATAEPSADLEYEPNPTVILEELLPRYVESRVYSALLDASASEHAARQKAMKAATDNAEELKISLTRVMNRARQDAITTEIMEIVGGAEALKKDADSDEAFMPEMLVPAHLFEQQLDPTDRARTRH